MKTTINKSAKRVLSLFLAFSLLIGTLFIANVGINIGADAATDSVKTKIVYWSGETEAPTEKDGVYIIDTAEKLAYIAQAANNKLVSYGKTYKVADDIKAFVLQTDDFADIINKNSAEDVRDFFENSTATPAEWIENGWSAANIFQGTFDGNGATIYGMYNKSGQTSLFGNVDGGGVIKNITIKNSYISTTSEFAAVLFSMSGQDSWNTNGTKGKGTITIENVVVANNYVRSTTADAQKCGVLIGWLYDYISINNCLLYGNNAVMTSSEYDNVPKDISIIGYYVGEAGIDVISNLVSIGTPVVNEKHFDYGEYYHYAGNSTGTNLFKNVYADQEIDLAAWGGTWQNIKNIWGMNTLPNVTGVTASMIKGVDAKMSMQLAWGTEWFEIEGEFPTPIKPAGWVELETPDIWDGSVATTFESGNGTEEDPFIIKTSAQLRKMVLDGGKNGGEPAYYKVDDNVKKIALSPNANRDNAGIKSAGDALDVSDALNWTNQILPVFNGHFDGNGVVITGMISKEPAAVNDGKVAHRAGFIPWLGRFAVVKNITFDGCYVKGGWVGMLSSKLTAYQDDNDNGTNTGSGKTDAYIIVSNVAVVNSAIVSNNGRPAGIIAIDNCDDGTYLGNIPDQLSVSNCLFDGTSCSITGTDPAGIVGGLSFANNFDIHDCVSIGVPLAAPGINSWNDPSTNNVGKQPLYIYNSYSDVDLENCNNDIYDSFEKVSEPEELIQNLGFLDWGTNWAVGTRKDGSFVPMPTVNTSDDCLDVTGGENKPVVNYNAYLGHQNDDRGADASGPYAGDYGYFSELNGSGTESDPYIIKTAKQLARVIGAGGKNLDQVCYFKLGCDIDLGGFQWLNAYGYRRRGDATLYYKYVPFEGTLDGDGHTITGLYATSGSFEDDYFKSDFCENDYGVDAALIPVLQGGTVKNLHIRDSHVAGGSEGYGAVIAANGEGTVIGCSVENTTTVNLNGYLSDCDTVAQDSYYYLEGSSPEATVIVYYDANGDELDPADLEGNEDFYKGATEGSIYRFVSHAKEMPKADIAGDGNGFNYDASDLTALRRRLLRNPDYSQTYADVNKDGRVNTSDLVALKRDMADESDAVATDGFWRNVQVGNVGIYYGENDNYDAARKLELFLERLYPGADITKYDATNAPDGSLDIIVGNVSGYTASGLGENQYKIEYDAANGVLCLYGGSFTGVEQAVIDFAANTTRQSVIGDTVYTQGVTDLPDEKDAITVGSQKYYYAWGDEFNETDVNYGTWHIYGSYNDDNSGDAYNSFYKGSQVVSSSAINKLVTIEDGRLVLKRGFRAGTEDKYSDTSNGYVCLTYDELGTGNGEREYDSDDNYFHAGILSTYDSMLFKQGYVEFEASVPGDGHSFPALWLMGTQYTMSYKNEGWANSLYSKVYPVNNDWNHTSTVDWSDNATKQFDYPSKYYELDIMEVMQNPDEITTSGGWFNWINPSNKYDPVYLYESLTTIHKYDRASSNDFANPNSTNFMNGYSGTRGYNFGAESIKYNAGYETKLQAERKWGFLWQTTSSGTDFTVYIYDTNGNGGTANTSYKIHLSEDIDEYMNILIDNPAYTSYKGDTTATQFNNNLSTSGTQSALKINYARVYQLDGKRDLVTRETEAFNNNNHFGY